MAHLLARQNLPVPVLWAGFESDTYRLGRAGWQVAIDEEPMRMEFQLVLHHPQFGLSAMGMMRDSFLVREMSIGSHVDLARLPPFVIQAVRAKGQMITFCDPIDLSTYHRVDTMPMLTRWEGVIEDLPLFKEIFAPVAEAQELIVDPQDVQAMLDQIMKVQAPMRKEIRQRDARREQVPMRQVHAQIISLKAA